MKYKLLYIDIETACKYKDVADFESNDIRGFTLFKKKHTKFKWNDLSLEDAFLEKGPLMSEYNRIVCISIGYFDLKTYELRVKSLIGDEEKILKDLIKIFANFKANKEYANLRLCGYNIKRFDIPLLNIKCYEYGLIPIPYFLDIKDKKPWEIDIVDIYEIWNKGFNNFASLDEVCYVLKVDSPKDKMEGKDVHHAFYFENRINDIAEYCEKDIKVLPELIEKIYG